MPISLRRRTRRQSPEPAPAPSLGALSLPDLTTPLVDTDQWPPPVPPVPGSVHSGSSGGHSHSPGHYSGGSGAGLGFGGFGSSRRDSASAASLSTSVPKDARLNGAHAQSSFGKPGVGSPWGAKRWTQSATSVRHSRSGSHGGGGHSRHGSAGGVGGGGSGGGGGHQRNGSSSSGGREYREYRDHRDYRDYREIRSEYRELREYRDCGGAGYGPVVYGAGCGAGGCSHEPPPAADLSGIVPESVTSCSFRDSQSTIDLSGLPGMGASTATLPFGDASTLTPYYPYGPYGPQTFPRSPTLGSSTYPSAESLSLLSRSRSQQTLPNAKGRAPSLVKDPTGANPDFHRPFAQQVVSPPHVPTALPGTVSARKRAQKRVAALTIMVAGPTGSGKTS